MPFVPWVQTVGGSTPATAAALMGLTAPDNYPANPDFGFVASSVADIGLANASAPLVAGVITLVMVVIRQAVTVTNVIAQVTSGGVTLTAAQNFAGVYDSTGTLRGTTADQTTNWGSAAVRVMPLTAAFTATPGTYYAAFVSNGTTPPTFRTTAGTVALPNAGQSGAALRFSTNGSGTSLPGSLTLSANAATNAVSVATLFS